MLLDGLAVETVVLRRPTRRRVPGEAGLESWMPSVVQAVSVAIRAIRIRTARAGLRMHIRKREAVVHVMGACRRHKAIRVARTGVSGADVMRGRKGMQKRVGVDGLTTTASESLGEVRLHKV